MSKYQVGQAFNFKQGDKVICNGFEGIVRKVLDGKLDGMVEVRLGSGEVCVSASFPNVYPAA